MDRLEQALDLAKKEYDQRKKELVVEITSYSTYLPPSNARTSIQMAAKLVEKGKINDAKKILDGLTDPSDKDWMRISMLTGKSKPSVSLTTIKSHLEYLKKKGERIIQIVEELKRKDIYPANFKLDFKPA